MLNNYRQINKQTDRQTSTKTLSLASADNGNNKLEFLLMVLNSLFKNSIEK